MDSNSIEIDRYERLKLQRLNASKKWNNANRDKVNEYNKFYQRRLNAKKRENREHIKNNNDPEKYKKYQKLYRMTSLLRKLPFFEGEIVF